MMHKPQPFWLTKNKRLPTTSLAKTAITVATLLTPAVHPTTHQWNWDKCQEARGTFATIKESKIKTDSTTKANIQIIINPIITKMPTTHAITSRANLGGNHHQTLANIVGACIGIMSASKSALTCSQWLTRKIPTSLNKTNKII
jgi:hypothetical protein